MGIQLSNANLVVKTDFMAGAGRRARQSAAHRIAAGQQDRRIGTLADGYLGA
jgi:hypothetical protein